MCINERSIMTLFLRLVAKSLLVKRPIMEFKRLSLNWRQSFFSALLKKKYKF